MARNRRGPLDPEGTRNSIVEAALTLLAGHGQEGVTFSEVARLASVDRGTVHRHFHDRDQLLAATAKLVSDQLFKAVFGESGSDYRFRGSADIIERNERLINFGMNNPELCRVWLFEVMSSEDPSADPFWKAFHGSYAAFAESDLAAEGLNTEALAVIMLASSFIWPIWVRSHARSDRERKALARSFSDECLRLSMYGSLKPDQFPEIATHILGGVGSAKAGKGAKTKAPKGRAAEVAPAKARTAKAGSGKGAKAKSGKSAD